MSKNIPHILKVWKNKFSLYLKYKKKLIFFGSLIFSKWIFSKINVTRIKFVADDAVLSQLYLRKGGYRDRIYTPGTG